MDARRLVLASQLVSVDNPALVLSWWRLWLDDAADNCGQTGWGRCREVLSEVREWQRSATDGHQDQTECLLQDVVIGKLCSMLGAPLELLLELLASASSSDIRQMLTADCEARVRGSLRGDLPSLPLPLAVAITNGETPVLCMPESSMFSDMTKAITERLLLGQQQDVDLFCRCVPSRALWKAVLERAGNSKIGLELQWHLRQSSFMSEG